MEKKPRKYFSQMKSFTGQRDNRLPHRRTICEVTYFSIKHFIISGIHIIHIYVLITMYIYY